MASRFGSNGSSPPTEGSTSGKREDSAAMLGELAELPGWLDALCADHSGEILEPVALDDDIEEPALTPREVAGTDPGDDALPVPVCALHAPPPEPIAWAIDDLWTRADFGLVVGEDGAMKSTITTHLCCAIAGGYKAFGQFATQQRPVLIVSGEDSQSVLLNRIEAIVRGQGWDRTQVMGNLHVLALAGTDLASPSWQAHLLTTVTRLNIGFVVFDPLAELAGGDEDNNTQRREVVKTLRALTVPTGASVCLVHHFGKPSEGRRKKDRIRGASGVPAASRATYHVEKTEDGIRIECLKLTRAERPAPFIVRYYIECDPTNRAIWQSARFEYVTVREATLDAADTFVLSQLADGVRMSTSDLKTAAKGTGVSGADIARALRVLETLARIDFEPGEKNAKLWGLCLPGKLGKPNEAVAGQAACLPGKHDSEGFCLPTPLGAGKQTPSSGMRSTIGHDNAAGDDR